MVIASDFMDVMRAVQAGDLEAFERLHRDLASGLDRYVRLRGGADRATTDLVWAGIVDRLRGFAGDERELRAVAYLVARQTIGADRRDPARRPRSAVAPPGRAGTDDGEHATHLIAASLPAEQADVVLLRVLGDLEVDDVAHVLRSSSGAVKRAQYRALVTLVHRLGARPTPPPDDEVVTSWMNLADPTPDMVFGGALPPWQARGPLAPVARLVAAARRPDGAVAPVSTSVLDAVRRLAPPAPARGIGRRSRRRNAVPTR